MTDLGNEKMAVVVLPQTTRFFNIITALLLFLSLFPGPSRSLKCYQCGGLSGLPCASFSTDKIEYQKVCNNTVQSCITSYSNGKVNLRDCWTNKAADTTNCDGVDSLMLCMCANSDFCNCHSNPDLTREDCPVPPNGGVGQRPTAVLLLQLLTALLFMTS